MQLLYAIINFVILAAILYIFGRKMVAKIFNSRRDRINAGLDEAEASPELPEEPEAPAPQPVAQPDPVPDTDSDKALAAVEAWKTQQLKELEEQWVRDSADLKREMLLEVRDHLTEQLKHKAAEKLASDTFLGQLRRHEHRLADDILQRIRLTSGDHSYLTRKDVLYVTLTSAYPLDQTLVDRIQEKVTQLVASAGGKISFWYKQDSSLIGGFQLRIGDTIYDCSMNNQIYHLAKAIGQGKIESSDPQDLLKSMEKTIQSTDLEVDVYQVGRVISVSDGICWLDGLADIMFGEVVEFDCGERGMVLDIEPDKVGAIIYGRYEHIESYSRVRRLGVMASVPVGRAMLGRVVDPLGDPIDGRGKIWTDETRPIEASAPAIPDRQAVDTPMHTGIKAIDALVPIGRGQRELIIGDRQTGKTSIAIDAIINQKGKGVACVYVAIGQKEASVAEIVAKLEACGAMEYTAVVCATASDSASLQYIAPFAGAAIAEHFMYNGQDALVIYDDLSKHAVAYRELSLLLHRPSGREAYPGDIFYLHSRLLERAARLSDRLGGGSVTALPIIETQSGDISAYIPTNVISITDGQIFLETELFNQGQRPAVNVGLSVSRVGSAAQTRLMKQFSAQLRTNLAQYRELESFTQFGSDVDDSTQRVLASGQRMMAALRQERFQPLTDWQQVLLIYAVSRGYADGIEPADMEDFAHKLYNWFRLHCASLTDRLATGAKLNDEADIRAALDAFVQQLRQ